MKFYRRLNLHSACDSVAMFCAWGAIGSAALAIGSTTLLFAASPFIPDGQEQLIKDFIPKPLIAFPAWAVTGIVLARMSNAFYPDEDSDMPSLPDRVRSFPPGCYSCKYQSFDLHLQPCALHPGRDDRTPCNDFEV